MKLKKLILTFITLITISSAVSAHQIGVSVEPHHYVIYVNQEINAHCTYGVHIGNDTDHDVNYHIVYWLNATGIKYTSAKEEYITLKPGQSYDKTGTDLYLPVKYSMHNYTAELTGGINLTPQGEDMKQYPAKNYINVY